MIFYTRSDVDDSWHWHRDCSRFPQEEPIMALYAPSGSPTSRMLCPECLRRDEEAGHPPGASDLVGVAVGSSRPAGRRLAASLGVMHPSGGDGSAVHN